MRSNKRKSKDRKSTRLNSSHSQISYAVFCLKKKKKCLCYGRSVRHNANTLQLLRNPPPAVDVLAEDAPMVYYALMLPALGFNDVSTRAITCTSSLPCNSAEAI